VIDRVGRMSVGSWGRDAHPGPDVVAVRQNLALIVDNGAPVAGLEANAGGRWGSARNQLQYTWRSGVGVDAAGNLYYAGGNQLHPGQPGACTQHGGRGPRHGAGHPPPHGGPAGLPTRAEGQPVPTPLLPTMPGPLTRYLEPDQRDFIAVTLR